MTHPTHPRQPNNHPTAQHPGTFSRPVPESTQRAAAHEFASTATPAKTKDAGGRRNRAPRGGTAEGCYLRSVFADNVRSRAKAMDLRLNALADRAGVSRSQFYNVLRQSSSPSLDWVAKIAAVLGVSPAELLIPSQIQATQAYSETQASHPRGAQLGDPLHHANPAPYPMDGGQQPVAAAHPMHPNHLPAGHAGHAQHAVSVAPDNYGYAAAPTVFGPQF